MISLKTSFACDEMAPRIEIEKAKSRIEYKSENNDIPTLVSDKRILFKERPSWIWLDEPRKEQLQGPYYYIIKATKNLANKSFKIYIEDPDKTIELDVSLNMQDPTPFRKLTEFEKACGKLPFSSTIYH